jgi:hypothetical protein
MSLLNGENNFSGVVHVGTVGQTGLTSEVNGGKRNPEELVTKIFNTPSECTFKDANHKAVCSPKHIVDKMAEFLDTKEKNPKKIVDNMKERMNCNSESCILKSEEFKRFAQISGLDTILDEFFKPSGPSQTFGLLSNVNIDNVLDQLENRFKGFLHIPYQMRDFANVGSELARVDLADQFNNKGIKSFGVVLNTDWSSGRGIHWYCIFGSKVGNKVIIEYFNSSGLAPLPETQAWLQKTKHYLNIKGMDSDIKYTTGIQFQNDDHSCGVYCLMYIWLRLEGVPHSWFKADNFDDSFMHKARKVLFRHEV